jgi:thymidine kinase
MIRHMQSRSEVSAGRGGIRLFTGPMFSGKSASLIGWIRRLERSGASVLTLVPDVAARFEGPFVVSHAGERMEARVVSSIAELERLPSATALAIDEAQFFQGDLAGVLEGLAQSGTEIGVAGLDRDFRGRPFATTLALESVASSICRLAARCATCGAPAGLTQRLVDGQPAPADEDLIRPGDEHLYEPRCENCFIRLPGY